MTSPVTEELQTTGSPVVLFMEGTQYLQKEAMITRIGLYRHPYKGASDEYCGILLARSRRRGVRPDETYPDVEPITEDEICELFLAKEFSLDTDKSPEEVVKVIHEYYVEKYPRFAALVRQNSEAGSHLAELLRTKTPRRLGDVATNSPVREEIFPGGPILTITEGTQLFEKEAQVTRINVYRFPYRGSPDEKCRIAVTRHRRRGVRRDEK